MEGFEDPFNRQTYPWGHEDMDLLEWYRALGRLRRRHQALRRGSIRYLCGKGPLLAFIRETEGERLLCVFNSGSNEHTFLVEEGRPQLILGQAGFLRAEDDGTYTLLLPPRSGSVFSVDSSGLQNG